jgi:Flp pilus assembly protein TadG
MKTQAFGFARKDALAKNVRNARKYFGSLARKLPGFDEPRAKARDDRGVAAVEFALVVPIAVLLLTGGVDYSDAISIQRKITLADRTVTDLVTQYTNISTSTLALNLAASAMIVAPYSSSNLVMTVSQVTTDAGGNATVAWSLSFNGTKRAMGSPVTLPVTVSQPNATFILGETQYTDTPIFGSSLTGTMLLHDTNLMSPRLVTSIPCADCT